MRGSSVCWAISILLTTVGLAGCGGGTQSTPLVNEVSVKVSPQGAALARGGTREFSAEVMGTVKKGVTWTVQEGPAGGSITAEGAYTAPGALGTFHVVATSVADPRKAATATAMVVANGFTLAGEMSIPRQYHSATLLANGEVLVAGGSYDICDPDCRSIVASSAELFNPTTGQFRATGAMSSARSTHTATPLADGKVLVVGGSDGTGPRSTAELYDPATGSFSAAGSMTDARSVHTATRLSDGKVFVAGGWTTSGTVLFTTEVYDPATRNFTPARGMTNRRGWHTATLLANGKVLLAGGIVDECTLLASAEIFDPSSGTFAPTGNLAGERYFHRATLLNDGRVLVGGGEASVASCWEGDFNLYDDAQLFDPVAGTFSSAGTMTTWRSGHTATLLPNGKVLLAGGWWEEPAADLFDPATATFSVTGGLVKRRSGHTATLLLDGRVLIIGGSNEKTAEIYQ